MYLLEDLFETDQVGRTFNYHVDGSGLIGFGGLTDVVLTNESDSVTLSRSVAAESATEEFEVRDTIEVDGDTATVTSDWSFTDNRAFLTHLSGESILPDLGAGDVSVIFSDLQVAPGRLRLDERHTDRSPVEVQIHIGDLSAVLTGLAEVTTRFNGHQQVEVPAGTFTAAKVEYDIEFDASGVLVVQGTRVELTAKMSQQTVSYAAPGLGIVQETSVYNSSIRGRIPGGASTNTAGQGQVTLELIDIT